MTTRKLFSIELSTLRAFFRAIKVLVPECRLHISKDGVWVLAVDTPNVAMGDVKIDNAIISHVGNEVVLGVDVSMVYNSLRALTTIIGDDNPTVDVSIVSVKDRQSLLNIDIPSIGYKSQFETLDPNTIRKDPNRPKLTLNSGFGCSGSEFINVIDICATFSDRCRISTNERGECLAASKSDQYQCRLKFGNGKKIIALSEYSIDYLKDIAQMFERNNIVAKFATDYPISFESTISPGFKVQYLLAPRVESDDNGVWLS